MRPILSSRPSLAPYSRPRMDGWTSPRLKSDQRCLDYAAEAGAPGSFLILRELWGAIKSDLCVEHAVDGLTIDQFRARIAKAGSRWVKDKVVRPSPSTVNRHLALLAEAGMVEVHFRGRVRAIVTHVTFPGLFEDSGGTAAHESARESRLAQGRDASRKYRERQKDRLNQPSHPPKFNSSSGPSSSKNDDGVAQIANPAGNIDSTTSSVGESAKKDLPLPAVSCDHTKPYGVSSPPSPTSPKSLKIVLSHSSPISRPPRRSDLDHPPAPTCSAPAPIPAAPPSPQAATPPRGSNQPSDASEGLGAVAENDVYIIKKTKTAVRGSGVGAHPTPVRPMVSLGDAARGVLQPGLEVPRLPRPAPAHTPPRTLPSLGSNPIVASALAGAVKAAQGRPDANAGATEDIRRPWTGPAIVDDALSEMIYQQMPEARARGLLPAGAWDAIVAVQPWEAWLKAGDATLTQVGQVYDRFRAAQAKTCGKVGPLLKMPMPTTPETFIAQGQAFCAGQMSLIGINGVALAELGLTPWQWEQALAATRDACIAGRVRDGRGGAGYLLAVARRLASGEP